MKNELIKSKLILSFEDESALKYVSGTGDVHIDKNELEDRGVLCFSVNRAKGWRQEFLNFEKFENLSVENWSEVSAFRFQLMVSNNIFEKRGWFILSLILQNTEQSWIELEGIVLDRRIRPDRWSKITVPFRVLKNGPVSVETINRVIFAFNSEHEVGGNFYLADLEIQ